ncbi:MAG: DUF58 domain-containing protein [Gemmataceae bacterium]
MKARLESVLAWLPFRREGLATAGLVLGIIITGLIKSINLVLLLGSFLAAIVLANVFLARRQVRSLEARRILPDLVHAGEPFGWRLKLQRTDGRRVLGLVVEEADIRQQWYVDDLAADGTAFLEATSTLPQRGLVRWSSLKASSGYPFGLAHFENTIEQSDEILVAPRLGILHRGKLRHWLRMHSPSQGLARVALIRHPAAQMEIHGLRPFRPGDSPRWVHWRTSARRGELMVREFEDLPNDNLMLIVDPIVPQGETATPQLERMLALAATIVYEWCRQKGDRFILALGGPKPKLLQGTTSRAFLIDALRELALIHSGPQTDMTALGALLHDPSLPASACLIVASEASPIGDALAESTNLRPATLCIAAGDDRSFFEWTTPSPEATSEAKGSPARRF